MCLLVLSGSCFVRTDQLDGETDWKLRVAVTSCQQQLQSDQVSIHGNTKHAYNMYVFGYVVMSYNYNIASPDGTINSYTIVAAV